ncbi:MAG: cytochrome ubiquinol oxidase subunit I, partial [Coriobacteriales bacterium]|nr:cytochrome ubiquinol oxidase subunit I [Coriobacteriales bacterium]
KSTWLVWSGSMLTALWIIIANSGMQTPAGFKIVEGPQGPKAVLTNFFAAAFNPTTLPRYAHTIVAVLMMGGFMAMAFAAYYYRRGTHERFARNTMAIGAAIALIFTLLMGPAGHWQAVAVAENQPTKLAAMEGMWDRGPAPLGLVGYVDSANKRTTALEIPGAVSFLATLDASTPYDGLNNFPADRIPTPAQTQITYQSYHIMIVLWLVMVPLSIVAWFMNRSGSLARRRGFLGFLMWAPIVPMLAIQTGWATAEVGRQPWIVWGQLRTVDAISKVVPAGQVLTTLILFTLFYTFLYVAWARVVLGFARKGPALGGEPSPVTEPVPMPSGAGRGAVTAASSNAKEVS